MGGAGYVLAFAVVFAAVLFGTGGAAKYLRARAILDRPNERSSHAAPTPRGGGIAVSAVLISAFAAIGFVTAERPTASAALLIGALVLAAVSWIDDLRGLPPWLRLAVQVAAATSALPALPLSGLVFQGLLPPLADHAAAVLVWVWFVNLFNFMDGIDGIAGVEAATNGFGLFLIALLFPAAGALPGFALYALTIVAAALGFLWWNWEPAKVFLGDVGSVPLGFLLGFLLLSLAAAGLWPAALILPLYYLADSGVTLVRRIAAGEKIWQAHAGHFYQRAARRLGSHAATVRAIAFADLCLVALALLACVGFEAAALVLAAAVTALLLAHLAGGLKP
jgi:UDP-N-acetylmuramyl pentapeptide phosphotransferase/UDP-N-acetylglucosamine-1-phosphate transferase